MDLYRVLRISIYLLVASGAFALSLAESNFIFLAAVLVFGALANATVDCRRVKPVRVEYALAMMFTLLLYAAVTRGREEGLEKLPQTLAHLLLALQVLLFFCAYRGSALLVFCGATLALVIISGVLRPDVSQLWRMIGFTVLTAWTLFVQALWHARENFNGRLAAGRPGSPAAAPDNRLLSPRAFWQGLRLIAGLSCACLAGGLLLLCLAPHLNESALNLINDLRGTPHFESQSLLPAGRDPETPISTPGLPEAPDPFLIPNNQDHRLALSVTFSAPLKDLAGRDGRIYMRARAFSNRQGGIWLPETASARNKLEARDADGLLRVSDPSVPDAEAGPEIKQEVKNLANSNRNYCALGTVTKLASAVAVEQDSEGALYWVADEAVDHYTLWSRPARYEENLPAGAVAEHRNYQRYVRLTGLPVNVVEDLRRRALEITARCETAPEKVRAILAWLRDGRRYRYALDTPAVTVQEFVLSNDPAKRRGHCQRFAEAFVLLCRLNDIPARLAIGFCAQVAPPQMASGEREITFKNSDAHAWGEVYFKGLGWVTCDPTPAAPAEPGKPPPEVAAASVASAAGSGPAARQGLLERAWTSLLNFNNREQRAMYTRFSATVGGTLGGAGAVFTGHTSFGWLGALLAWLAFGALFFHLLQMLLRHSARRGGQADPSAARARAALAFYNDLLQVLSRCGFMRRPGQTPREFAEFVVRRGGAGFKPVWAVTEIFERVRYGGAELSQEEFNRLQAALDLLRELTFLPASRLTSGD